MSKTHTREPIQGDTVEQIENDTSTSILEHVGMNKAGFMALIVLAILPLIPPFNQEYLVRWMIVGLFMAAQTVAFNFTNGYISIVNFGFAAFVGLGAYTSGILSTKLGISPWLTIFMGAIPPALVGFLTGILTLRLRGIYAAIMAWFVGLALMGLATKMIWLTEGPMGLNCPQLLDSTSNVPYFYVILVMFLVVYIVLNKIVQSHAGLAFIAIGQNMDAARTSGINPTFYRVLNFTVSCTFAGWLGGFYAHYYGILMPDLLHTTKTVEVLVIGYLGGRFTLWGGAVVAIPFVFVMELVRSSTSDMPGVNLIFYGLFLIVIMIYYPGGLAHFYENFKASTHASFLGRLFNRKAKQEEINT